MRNLEALTNLELVETVEHGLDEFNTDPAVSLCFTIQACVVLLGRVTTREQFAEHARHVANYVREARGRKGGDSAVDDAFSEL